MKYKIIHHDLIKSVIAPVLCACFLLALSFSFMLKHYHQKDVDGKIALAHQFLIINQLHVPTTTQQKSPSLEEPSMAILAMPIFKSVYIFDTDGHLISQNGLPENIEISELQVASRSNAANKVFLYEGLKYATLNLKNSHKAIVGLNLSIFDINHYKGLIIIIGVCFICIFVLQFFMRSFNRTVFYSIRQIERGVSDLIAFNYDKKIPATNVDSFKPITNMVNKLGEIQKRVSEQVINDIEQSTSELRETLETVEMQNIELDIARKNATEASRVKSQFLANTSHEVKTPLNGILGFSRLLKKTTLDDQQKEYLSTIESSAEGLLTIMNDVLDFSRLDIGTLTLDYKPIKLRELLNETLHLHAHTAEEKRINLLTFVEHDVPEELLGDPLRLKQILSNLVSNAIKFSEADDICVTVKKDNSIKNHFSLRFEVQDLGVGLTEEQKNSIFKPFVQLDGSDSRLNGGIGLGLAIAKGLIRKMHGSIGVDSIANEGATFWFTIALGRDLNINHSQLFLYDTLRNIHALVYDSSPKARQEVIHYLEGWGADSTPVERLEDVIDKAQLLEKRNPITIAILDCYSGKLELDKFAIRKTILDLHDKLDVPIFVLASKSVQRILEDILTTLNYIFIDRPLLSNQLHENICNRLEIASQDEYLEKFHLADTSSKPARSINIMVVDDNPANLKLVTELLKGLNINVVSIDSGEEAVKTFFHRAFDLIFMDIQMPGMDGLEATRKIRDIEHEKKLAQRTPIVALTAHAVSEQKQRLLLAGMDDALSKPVSENDIRHVIERWTGEKLHVTRSFSPARVTPSQLQADMSPPKAGDKPKSVDLELGLSLANNNSALAADMLTMLIDSLEATKHDIIKAQQANDLQALEEVIHKLHGGCCYTGVPYLKEISFKIDDSFQKAQLENIEYTTNLLIAEIKKVQDWAQSNDANHLYAAMTENDDDR